MDIENLFMSSFLKQKTSNLVKIHLNIYIFRFWTKNGFFLKRAPVLVKWCFFFLDFQIPSPLCISNFCIPCPKIIFKNNLRKIVIKIGIWCNFLRLLAIYKNELLSKMNFENLYYFRKKTLSLVKIHFKINGIQFFGHKASKKLYHDFF